MEKPV